MSDAERRFHELWLGMAQPSEGLVVSVPVLTEAQCMARLGRETQDKLLALLEPAPPEHGGPRLTSLPALFDAVLDLDAARFDAGDALPKALHLYVPEGRQDLRPSCALRSSHPPARPQESDAAAARAGAAYAMLVWEVPPETALDKPETVTGPWEYPAQAKFERLLRECRVPIGLLSNGRELRLVYAPHGESTGWLSFRVADMATVGGRPILDAFVMLLGRERWFSVSEEQSLPALLAKSRRHQASVTNDLAGQVFEALEEVLRGFADAAERAPEDFLRRAMEQDEAHVYSGLLTLLLRLVFCLYSEDRGLLPTDNELYAEHYSVLGLFDQLEKDHGRYPDAMQRRFGAYPRLLSLFRAIYLGVQHGELKLPPRRGALFDPNTYPFLEGWGGGSAPVTDAHARAAVPVPAVDDGTLYRVLERLIVLDGQRLSYRALDVEQIGSVYEALMGYNVERLQAGAVRIRLGSKKARAWLEAKTLLAVPAARRARWLQEELGCDKNVATKIAAAVASAKTEDAALDALEPFAARGRGRSGGAAARRERAPAGALVIQPGPERRRTSSHYTPPELADTIVARTLEPLIRALGERPRSEQLLDLVICDPAMGSGAFLVAACRYLADQVVAAWTREAAEGLELFAPLSARPGSAPPGAGKTRLQLLADANEDAVHHARRLVAQRCLYGVDKNPYAVQLARLSLWLVTLSRDQPFTFLDHALRHGDSLVGLGFDQIRAFHWKPGKQIETTEAALRAALDEAVGIRQRIQALAPDDSPAAQQEKQRLLADAEDALDRARLIGDLIVGAFFACDKDKDREKERNHRLDLVQRWLAAPDTETELALEAELRALQAELRKTQIPFHWMIELPEVFYLERPDPLDGGKVNGAAWVDAFVGNPPFLGGSAISSSFGDPYRDWLLALHEGAHGNADLSAHFFRRAAELIGKHGAIGLIATNTIGQGDTRATGLQHLLRQGFTIHDATVNLPWPGEAAVTVSVVHLARGALTRHAASRLGGQPVAAINSRLRPRPERADPQKLAANAACSFLGSKVYGQGFTLTPEERDALIARDPKNAERIFPYLGGEEVNTSPTQSHDRYVVSFGQMSLQEAEQWPDLIAIVREKVKPERDRLKDNADGRHRKQFWWQFGRWTPALYEAIAPLERCLANSLHSKHLVLAFEATSQIFSHGLNVFAFEAFTSFAILQSRIHERWARLLSSTMEDRLRYAASDCFETFPFPGPDPRAIIPELEAIGERLYEARAAYMRDTQQGLTKTYNALKDPAEHDPRVLELRALHEALDRAVLRAYPRLPDAQSSPDTPGWSDIPVPPYCIATPEDQAALTAFEDEVLDRLFLLNELRAHEEQALGRGAKGKPAKRSKPRTPRAPTPDRPKTKKAKKAKTPSDDAQGSLDIE